MRATKIRTRTILVVLRLPTFGSNFATLICITNAQTYVSSHTRNSVLCEGPPKGSTSQQLTTAPASQSKCIFSERKVVDDVKIQLPRPSVPPADTEGLEQRYLNLINLNG